MRYSGTAIVRGENGETDWWTFAGVGGNATLAYELSQMLKSRVTYNSFTMTFAPYTSVHHIEHALHEIQTREVKEMHPAIEERAILSLKFSECLPDELAIQVLQSRLHDPDAVTRILFRPTHFMIDHEVY